VLKRETVQEVRKAREGMRGSQSRVPDLGKKVFKKTDVSLIPQ